MHEASLWPSSVFATFTYDEEHLPRDGSLDVSEFQRFMKRLRRVRSQRIRFFHCGEYGERLGRPHYHALLFNLDFPDKVPWDSSTFQSAELEKIWGLGRCILGAVTFESAAYVARYCMKKITGTDADEHYTRVNTRTGEIVRVAEEYATMSRRPGIGRAWFEQYADEVFPRDSVYVRGYDAKPPRAYQKWLAEVDPLADLEVRAARAREADPSNATEERLRVREVCAEARLTLYGGRRYESGQVGGGA